MVLKKEQFQKFLQKQKERIEKEKWCEGERRRADPGESFCIDWINKNAKRFRKEYAIDDIKQSLNELRQIRKGIDEYMKKIVQLTDFANTAEEKLLEAIEFLENEKENGENNDK